MGKSKSHANKVKCFWCSKLISSMYSGRYVSERKADIICNSCERNLNQLNLGKCKGKRILIPKKWYHSLLAKQAKKR